MDLTALASLDVDDVQLVEGDALVGVSGPGIVTGADHPATDPPPTCSPVHTHAVGALPAGPPDLAVS